MSETLASLLATSELLGEASVTVGTFEERAWVPQDIAAEEG